MADPGKKTLIPVGGMKIKKEKRNSSVNKSGTGKSERPKFKPKAPIRRPKTQAIEYGRPSGPKPDFDDYGGGRDWSKPPKREYGGGSYGRGRGFDGRDGGRGWRGGRDFRGRGGRDFRGRGRRGRGRFVMPTGQAWFIGDIASGFAGASSSTKDVKSEKVKEEASAVQVDILRPVGEASADDPTILSSADQQGHPQMKFEGDPDDEMRPILLPFSNATEIDLEEHDRLFADPADDEAIAAEEDALYFFQLPTRLPAVHSEDTMEALQAKALKEEEEAEGMEENVQKAQEQKEKSITNQDEDNDVPHDNSLKKIAPGHIGKLQMYRSGKVKLLIGGTAFDVTAGLPCHFVQDIVSIDAEKRTCSFFGQVTKRAICTPDFEQLFIAKEKELAIQQQQQYSMDILS